MAIKIVIIGAGSGFGGRLSLDIMASEVLRNATIGLCDIHPGRLEKVRSYVQRMVDAYRLPTRVVASTNRTELLPEADFVITSIAAGGGAYYGFPYHQEIEIPRKYGIEQSVADTCSVGAVFRFLRTGPVQHQIIKDIERLCPQTLVLNHTNPMAMLIWLHSMASAVRVVGLCHSVQGTTARLAQYIGVPSKEISYKVAGINHLAWVLEFMRGKEDLYPLLRQAMDIPDIRQKDLVRFELMEHFGYFPTESSRHNSEYLPYFRRTPELLAYYELPLREVGEQRPSVPDWMKDTGAPVTGADTSKLQRSQEFTIGIMEAIVTNQPFRFHGNVLNTGLIPNLPPGCCVEVPCLADARGIHPCYVGPLPPQLAALNSSNVAVHELAVEAVLRRNREAAFHAVALDPLTASLVSLRDMRKMFDELWEAEKTLLTWFDPDRSGQVPELCAAG